jgi:hypothetical protein
MKNMVSITNIASIDLTVDAAKELLDANNLVRAEGMARSGFFFFTSSNPPNKHGNPTKKN